MGEPHTMIKKKNIWRCLETTGSITRKTVLINYLLNE